MTKEIKEILYMLKSVIDNPKETFCANATTCYLLLNYITNLQKDYDRIYNENCKLRERNNIDDINLLDENYVLQKENEKLKEENKRIFSRVNKAIELIKKALIESDITGNGTLNLSNLLNILDGGDE